MSIAQRPAVRAAALLWIWLTVLFAPVGATLHAMSHLRLAAGHTHTVAGRDAAIGASARLGLPHAAALPGRATDGPDTDASPEDAHHGAAAHCHVCDEWHFLDHAIASAALPDVAESSAPPPQAARAAMPVPAEAPWILPRAPPSR